MVDVCMYGVCLVDTVIGNLTLGQFADDSQRSRLRTLLARYCPTEVLLATGNNSRFHCAHMDVVFVLKKMSRNLRRITQEHSLRKQLVRSAYCVRKRQ